MYIKIWIEYSIFWGYRVIKIICIIFFCLYTVNLTFYSCLVDFTNFYIHIYLNIVIIVNGCKHWHVYVLFTSYVCVYIVDIIVLYWLRILDDLNFSEWLKGGRMWRPMSYLLSKYYAAQVNVNKNKDMHCRTQRHLIIT